MCANPKEWRNNFKTRWHLLSLIFLKSQKLQICFKCLLRIYVIIYKDKVTVPQYYHDLQTNIFRNLTTVSLTNKSLYDSQFRSPQTHEPELASFLLTLLLFFLSSISQTTPSYPIAPRSYGVDLLTIFNCWPFSLFSTIKLFLNNCLMMTHILFSS